MKKHKLPKGFLVNGIHCGLKKKRKDLSLFYSKTACNIAAIFTKNIVKAAPVILAQKQLKKSDKVRAVIVNSGNANCMTGTQGLKDAEEMSRITAEKLEIDKDQVMVSSTGIIGQPMDMDPVIKSITRLAKGLSRDGLVYGAEGIMTTDSFYKIASASFLIGKKKITITGAAKGAGMIHPDMATMLCYIMTDANISKKALKKALAVSADSSLNAITVDGDMSTNDTVMLLSNGEAGNKLINEKDKSFKDFQKALDKVAGTLACMIVKDGEGASKLAEVRVTGAKSVSAAKKVAESIAGSLLVKCAVLGGDPNWGRIASSAGASGVKFDPDKMEIKLDGVTFFKNGKVVKVFDRKSISVFKGKSVKIEVDLNNGNAEACKYTCDISKKYITLNSYYTT